ncbi:hypothetical protein ROA7023_02901 [Roseisalinus antarcticus]|uniref:HTH cro/C1-type domain-containing protein n=2 Tax=Roseisalinus antarcticus TaxID=254357 RepID=A0A1Y5TE64_9RHOB|nr:hypothetical protein ROA7023_02901 [Roseisalinus antarcticus]
MRIARLRRKLTLRQMALDLGVHRTTYGRLENGDPGVSMGLYSQALFLLGLGTPFDDLADPNNDTEGQRLDVSRLPRIRDAGLSAARLRPAIGSSDEPVLRIGVLGVMSGPAAAWGLVSRYCAEATAEMYNDAGGVEIGKQKYRIEIVSFDDRFDPFRSTAGARWLTEEKGIKYVIGPNVEQTITAAIPIAERKSAMLFPYSFTRSLYSLPRENSVLAQVAGYQAVPIIYDYLKQTKGAESISIVAPRTPEGLRQRNDTVSIAGQCRLRMLSCEGTYVSGSADIEEALGRALRTTPDILALSNVAPNDATRLIRRARELGFGGYITTESAQDVDLLTRTVGSDGDGLIMLGGASPPDKRTQRMRDFIARFNRLAGAWNDEAGTKAHTLEIILGTLQIASERALHDTSLFKAAIPDFSSDNPFFSGRTQLNYRGSSHFNQKRQIALPLVVNEISGGNLKTLLVRQPEEYMV